MTTWNEIIDIKLDKIKASKPQIAKKKKKPGCLTWGIGIFIVILGLPFLFKGDEPNFEKYQIEQVLSHDSKMGDIELYQLGERKLSQDEQKKTEYKDTTTSKFEMTNTVSEKYFIDNKTNNIGKILDTIPMTDGHLWLKVELDKDLYRKPINFDLISDEFTEKLKVESSYIFTENLQKDFYIRVCNVDKGELVTHHNK